MKKLLFIIAFLFTTALSFAQQQEWVNGYTRNNGTYVQGHYRTVRDYTRNNNWITIGNVNPHTGKAGTQPGDGRTTTRTISSNYSEPTIYRSINISPIITYSSQSYNSNQTIYTGPRGGQYYINSNGNKSYISN